MTTLAFKATYSDWKLIKTRGVVQVVMEVPLSEADAAYQILGGMPDFSHERWFGVAPLKNPPAEKESSKAPAEPQPATDKPPAAAKRDWRDVPVSQQAGIHLNDPMFTAFLKEEYADEWHETGDADSCLKFICGVERKRDIAGMQPARVIWHQLDKQFHAWRLKERVGA